eukprot:2542142-Rhodomonas_salina.1
MLPFLEAIPPFSTCDAAISESKDSLSGGTFTNLIRHTTLFGGNAAIFGSKEAKHGTNSTDLGGHATIFGSNAATFGSHTDFNGGGAAADSGGLGGGR